MTRGADRPVVAVAGGRAFTFRYAETDELLRAAGCARWSSTRSRDETLPAGTAGIYLGGGFPEVHAAELWPATPPCEQRRPAAIAAGVPTVAECAGLLYLCRTVDGAPMVGRPRRRRGDDARLTLATAPRSADHDQLLARRRRAGSPGTSSTAPSVDARRRTPPGWLLDGAPAGFAWIRPDRPPTLHASYLHTHWAGHPTLAQPGSPTRCTRTRSRVGRPGTASRTEHARHKSVADHTRDLHHHGDANVAEDLVDLAVNVRSRPRRRGWPR